jgi:hypothetical protein
MMSDADTLVSEEQTLVESPIIVALHAFVSEATIDPQPISVALPSSEATLNTLELPTESDIIITTDSDVEDEQPIQTGTTLE